MTRNQWTLLVSGTVAGLSLIKELRLQKIRFNSVINFNRLFREFAAWYERYGRNLGVNEFHREFKKNFEFIELAQRALK